MNKKYVLGTIVSLATLLSNLSIAGTVTYTCPNTLTLKATSDTPGFTTVKFASTLKTDNGVGAYSKGGAYDLYCRYGANNAPQSYYVVTPVNMSDCTVSGATATCGVGNDATTYNCPSGTVTVKPSTGMPATLPGWTYTSNNTFSQMTKSSSKLHCQYVDSGQTISLIMFGHKGKCTVSGTTITCTD